MTDSQQYDRDLMTCVHCGLCLNSCPTYLETGSEADSPRGRIALMRALHEGRVTAREPDVVEHLDRCLGCLSCETACPSAVPYGRLIEAARERIADGQGRARTTEASRRAMLGMLTNPAAMSVSLKMAQTVGGGRMPGFVARVLAGGETGDALPLALPEPSRAELPPVVVPAIRRKRARVGMLLGCVMRVIYSDTNAETVRVLAANGVEVLTNRRQGCCGALHAHNGYGDAARAMARKLIDAFTPFDGLDAVIVNSAGCGSTMKHYGEMLADDPDYAAKAHAFAAKVRDVSEFLDELGWVAPLKPLAPEPVTATYHDACHLAHGQGIRTAPRALLERIPGLTLVPLSESEICCGSAGIYNITQPDMAERLQRRKLENIRATGASIVATGNPGCLAWIEAGVEREADPIRVAHPITLLAEALAD
jgi:glycolate oxidase iron-sulfur subunit